MIRSREPLTAETTCLLRHLTATVMAMVDRLVHHARVIVLDSSAHARVGGRGADFGVIRL